MEPNEHPDQGHEAMATPPQQSPSKARQSFATVRRELSGDGHPAPTALDLLMNEIERLELEGAELKVFRDKYYQVDRECAVLGEKTKISVAYEVLNSICLAMGGVVLGYAPSLWNHQPAGYILIVVGVALMAGGVTSRVIRK